MTNIATMPIGLWIDGLENHYWSTTGMLRGPINDPQICGDGFCALGVLCDLFVKHAPEAKEIDARWDGGDFLWKENDWHDRRQKNQEPGIPAPVLGWWRRYHAIDLAGIIEFNDLRRGSFRELALYLRGMAGMHYLTEKK